MADLLSRFIIALFSKAAATIFVLLFSLAATYFPTSYTDDLIKTITASLVLSTILRLGSDNLVLNDVRNNSESTLPTAQFAFSIILLVVCVPLVFYLFEGNALKVLSVSLALSVSASLRNLFIGKGQLIIGVLLRGVGPYLIFLVGVLMQPFYEIDISSLIIIYLVFIFLSFNYVAKFNLPAFNIGCFWSDIRVLFQPYLVVVAVSNALLSNILIFYSSVGVLNLNLTDANLVQRLGNAGSALSNIVFWSCPSLAHKDLWKKFIALPALVLSTTFLIPDYIIIDNYVAICILVIVLYQLSVGLCRVYDLEGRHYGFLALDHLLNLGFLGLSLLVFDLHTSFLVTCAVLLFLRKYHPT